MSQSFAEQTTEAVMEWLQSWKVPFVRVNAEDIEGSASPSILIGRNIQFLNFSVDDVAIRTSDISAVWYRRWTYSDAYRKRAKPLEDRSHEVPVNSISPSSHLRRELQTVTRFVTAAFKTVPWLGRPNNSMPNKLNVLRFAAELELDIPDTLVTTKFDEVKKFAAQYGGIITKPLSDGIVYMSDGQFLSNYTMAVPPELLVDDSRWSNFPSLFQEQLKKLYEIRAFFLDGKFYSMAIFSQQCGATQVDFRKYQYHNPNRTVPYRLSTDIEEKLSVLMSRLGLATGSIDLVRTVDGRMVFLEVNPVGQFGMVSDPCNYFLEREVAHALVRRANEAKA